MSDNLDVIPFEKLDTKTKDALSTYKFPTKPKQIKKTDTKAKLIKRLSDSMGWDWFIDTKVSNKCLIPLSNKQKTKIDKNYYIAITDNVEDITNMYISIYNYDFYKPIKYCKIKSLTKKQIRWLIKMF